ncbi:MAG: hypothetical protein DDT31_01420 [Syntrophomonadaceae bacterium]|nr:hypothetical protein [Bacillota bacterium]
MSTVVFATKLRAATVNVDVDISARMAVGENALTIASAMEVLSGVDPNPAAMLSGAPSITNNIARQRITGGNPGVIYQLTLAVRTSNFQILLSRGNVVVLSSATVVPA